jgi:hypothetical protein
MSEDQQQERNLDQEAEDFFVKYPWFKIVAASSVALILIYWFDALYLLGVLLKLIFIPLLLLMAFNVITEETFILIKGQLSSKDFRRDLKEHLKRSRNQEDEEGGDDGCQ